jgi:glycosyltransferase involved in cell wall biosynthesis
MARVGVVRQSWYPLDTRVRREVAALLDAGHEVEVVCLRRKGEKLRERDGRLSIWRIPIEHQRGAGIAYVLEHAVFLVAAGLLLGFLHLRRRYDVVQANTIPDTVVFAALIPRLTGARVLIDLHECMPEFFETRFGPGRGVRLVARAEQLAIRFAHRAITCTEPMRRRFAERGADPERIDVVLNSADERLFSPRDAAPHDDFRLICHGTLEDRYGVDTVIRAVALLAGELPELRFDVFGEGSQREELIALAEELGVGDRVRFSDGFVPLDELLDGIAAADIGIVAMKRDSFRDLTHCNKMFDYFSMRTPAAVSWTRSVAEYFDEDAVEFFTSDDPEDLARAIRRLHDDPARRASLVEGATRENEPYRWPRQRDLYVSVVERLVAE